MWTVIGLLAGVAIVQPLAMAPKADPFVLPLEIPADMFVAFWLPITRRLSGGAALSGVGAAAALLLVVPLFTFLRAPSRFGLLVVFVLSIFAAVALARVISVAGSKDPAYV